MEKITSKKLGKILIELNLVNSDQLEEALRIHEKTGGYLGEILLHLGYIKEENFAHVLALQFGQDLPFINLGRHNINPKVIKMVPREFVERYRIAPVDEFQGILTVATASPENLDEGLEKLKQLVKADLIQVVLTTTNQIYKMIAKYYGI